MDISEQIEKASEEATKYYREYHDNNGYRIRCGYYYPVYKQEVHNKVFYKIPITKSNIDGTKITAYKNISFVGKQEVDIKDGDLIKPLKIFEDFYFRKEDKYNPVFTLKILEWETMQTEKKQKENALNEYKKSIEMSNIILEDDDLPF